MVLFISSRTNSHFKSWSITLEHLLVWWHWNSLWFYKVIAEFDFIEYFVRLLCRFLKVHIFNCWVLASLRFVFLGIILVQTTQRNLLGFTLEHSILFFDVLDLSLKSFVNTLGIVECAQLWDLKLTWSSVISSGWWNTSFDTLTSCICSWGISSWSFGTWLGWFRMLNYFTYVTIIVLISSKIFRREEIDFVHFVFRTFSSLFFFRLRFRQWFSISLIFSSWIHVLVEGEVKLITFFFISDWLLQKLSFELFFDFKNLVHLINLGLITSFLISKFIFGQINQIRTIHVDSVDLII